MKRPSPKELEGDAGPLYEKPAGYIKDNGVRVPFWHGPPHNSTPTSIQAAASKRSTAPIDRARILAYIQSRRDGATREEIEEALGISGNSVRPRVAELLGDYGHSKVIREGPTTRKTKAGRNAAILWGTL